MQSVFLLNATFSFTDYYYLLFGQKKNQETNNIYKKDTFCNFDASL